MNKTSSIQSRLDALSISRLRIIADSKGVSFSSLIRMILIEYLETKQRNQK